MTNVGQFITPLNKYCLQKMSNYCDDSTNFTSNPLSNPNFFLKQKLIHPQSSLFEDDNSKTIPFHSISPPIDEATIKHGKLPKKITA